MTTLFPDAVKISAKTHEGFELLSAKICDELLGEEVDYIIPMDKQFLLNEARKTGIILEENWLDDGIHIKVKGGELKKNPRLSNLLSPHAENPEQAAKSQQEPETTGFKKKFGSDW